MPRASGGKARRAGPARPASFTDALQSCLAFGFRYLPHLFKLPAADMHREWDELTVSDVTRGNLQAHRESAKSTFWAICYPTWRTCLWKWLKREGQPQEDEHGAIFGVDAPSARARLRQVRGELEGNPAIIRDFGRFEIGPRWSESEIVVKGAMDTKNPTLFAAGWGAVPGPRLTYAIVDDSTHPLHVHSRAMRDKQSAWIDEVIEPMMKAGAPIWAIHTTYHNDDLPSRLRRAGWWSKRWPLVVDMDAKIVSWPEAWPWERVVYAMKKPLVFARQYMLREVLAEERLLPMPEFYDERILEYRDAAWRIKGNVVRMATGVDPATTESELKRGSRTAIVTAAVTDTFYKHVVEFKFGRWGPDRVLDEIVATWRKWSATEVYIEEVAFSKVFATLLRKETPVPARGSSAVGDKLQRIVGTLNPEMSNHKVLFVEEGDEGMREGVREIIEFPGETVDGADALEHLVRNVNGSKAFAVAGAGGLIANVRRRVGGGSGWIHTNYGD